MTTPKDNNLMEVAQRIREMREIMGFTAENIAASAEKAWKLK